MYDRELLKLKILDVLVDDRVASASEIARRIGVGRGAVGEMIEYMADREVVVRDGTKNTVDTRIATVILKVSRSGAEIVSFVGSGDVLLRRRIRFAAALTYSQSLTDVFADVSRYIRSLTGYRRVMSFLIYDGTAELRISFPPLFDAQESREMLIANAINKACEGKTLLYVNKDSDTMFMAMNGMAITEGTSLGKCFIQTLRSAFEVSRPYAVAVEGSLDEDETSVRKLCIDKSVRIIRVGDGHALSICEREAAKLALATADKKSEGR